VSARVLGAHAGCGGEVIFQVEPGMSWRYCRVCRSSTLRGQGVELAPAETRVACEKAEVTR
jgi:hypothetical protein